MTTLSTTSLTARTLDQTGDHDLWNSFVGGVPEGDVLQAWEWADVKGPEWAPVRVGVFRDGTLIAGAQILKRALRIGRLPALGTFYYAPRGPIMRDWNDQAALEALLAAIAERAKGDRAAFLKIDPAVRVEREDILSRLKALGFGPPASADAQGFGGTQPRCVMQLDLTGKSQQDLLAEFKPQTRRNIKLATDKHGVRAVKNVTREHLADFDRLMQVTGERDGFRPRPLSYFQTVWDHLVPVGMAKLFLTIHEGDILSGALCFKINDKAWYVYGASSNDKRNVMPNYAMQWEMIAWAQEEGCSWYDFRGVSPRRRQEGEDVADLEKNDHLQGLNRFKEGFSPRYVEYLGEFDLVYNSMIYAIYNRAFAMRNNMKRRKR